MRNLSGQQRAGLVWFRQIVGRPYASVLLRWIRSISSSQKSVLALAVEWLVGLSALFRHLLRQLVELVFLWGPQSVAFWGKFLAKKLAFRRKAMRLLYLVALAD